MKRLAAVLLSVILLSVLSVGSAVTYTLPEKMSRQLIIGSGLKGTFSMTAQGSVPAFFPAFLSGAEIQVRGISSGSDWHYYAYQSDESEKQWARTDLYHHDDNTYLKSDLIPGGPVLMIPGIGQILDHATQSTNPSFSSVLWNYLRMKSSDREDFSDLLSVQYAKTLESWLSAFAAEPSVTKDARGNTLLEMNYVIPASALKEKMLDIAEKLSTDEAFLSFSRSIMTEEQQKLYLNQHLRYFYEEALNSLQFDFDVTLNRTVTLQGDTVSSQMEFPLDPRISGYSALLLEESGGYRSCRLTREAGYIEVIHRQDADFQKDGELTLWILQKGDPAEANSSFAKKITLSCQTETYEEEDHSRSHETQHWNLSILPDLRFVPEEEREGFASGEAVSASADLHYYSKYEQSSPTTLEVEATLRGSDWDIAAKGKFKTASPWIFSPFSVENSANILELSPENLLSYVTSFLKEAEKQLLPNAQPAEAAESAPGSEPAGPAPSFPESTEAPQDSDAPADEDRTSPEEPADSDSSASAAGEGAV